MTLRFYISGQAAKSNIFNVRLTEPNKKISVFRLVALMLGSQWNGCITVKKCNAFTVMPSQYWEIHNICDIIYIISNHLLSETFTVLSRLCSFTRNSVLFCYIYKTVIHLFYFYTIKCVCVCTIVCAFSILRIKPNTWRKKTQGSLGIVSCDIKLLEM